MRILVYCEPLSVPTSGTPGRGMLKELIAARQNDQFILVLRTPASENKYLAEFINSIAAFKNWTLLYQRPSRKVTNIKALIGLREYCSLSFKADVYVNMDCDYLGRNAHPLIITVADLSVLKGKNVASYSKWINFRQRNFVLKNGIIHADHIVAISHATANEVMRYFPAKDPASLGVVHNGIAEEWFHTGMNKGDNPYFIWWGHISARKNLARLLEAYALARKTVSSGKKFPILRIIHSGTEVPGHLLEIVEEKNISAFVSWEQSLPLDKLTEVVSGAAGLLFPSLIEGFGLPVIESLACGTPVLTSGIEVMKEVGGENVTYCDPMDINSIAEGIVSLSSGHYTEDAVKKRKAYASAFTYKEAAARYAELIEKACDGSR